MSHYQYYNTNLDWIKKNTIYLTIHGSKAYGTNIATSDTDYRGIVIPPKEYYLGLKKNFENYVQNQPDLTVFEMRKFIKLAIDNNPNVLEILFTDPNDHVYIHPLGEKILSFKEEFLSKKCKNTFSGYAVGQLKRIKRHYEWIMNPPKKMPTRKECGLPELTLIPKNQIEAVYAAIRKQLDKWNWHELENVDSSTKIAIQTHFEETLCEIMQWHWSDLDDKIWLSAANQIGLDTNMIDIITKEKVFTSKLKEWNQYQDWLKNRNPERAILEEKYGFDCKHGYHLVRLQRMCLELLEKKLMLVKRPDAQELIDIRNGKWSFEQLLDYSEQMDNKINNLYLTSNALPANVDEDKVDNICIQIIEESFRIL